jgi:hypothetical protein
MRCKHHPKFHSNHCSCLLETQHNMLWRMRIIRILYRRPLEIQYNMLWMMTHQIPFESMLILLDCRYNMPWRRMTTFHSHPYLFFSQKCNTQSLLTSFKLSIQCFVRGGPNFIRLLIDVY